MKQNPGNVSLREDQEMIGALCIIFKKHKEDRPLSVVESGTYRGEGTTQCIIEAIFKAIGGRNLKRWKMKIHTIESDYGNFMIAKENLEQYEKWIKVIHGTSVDVQEALEFIEQDEALLNHEDYPDLYIDAQDPIPFYKNEIMGLLPEFGTKHQGKKIGKNFVFEDLIPEVCTDRPLFVLDSCGGIGWLEFNKVLELMGKLPFYLFLHDINHIKHFRSYEFIKQTDYFQILNEKEGEWVLAYKKPTS
jgi:hypothetical protein